MMNETAFRLAGRIFDRRLIQNQFRSAFVEAMVEPYLEGWNYVGDDWGGWDFERQVGERIQRLEVKQSAAQQTWSKIGNADNREL